MGRTLPLVELGGLDSRCILSVCDVVGRMLIKIMEIADREVRLKVDIRRFFCTLCWVINEFRWKRWMTRENYVTGFYEYITVYIILILISYSSIRSALDRCWDRFVKSKLFWIFRLDKVSLDKVSKLSTKYHPLFIMLFVKIYPKWSESCSDVVIKVMRQEKETINQLFEFTKIICQMQCQFFEWQAFTKN